MRILNGIEKSAAREPAPVPLKVLRPDPPTGPDIESIERKLGALAQHIARLESQIETRLERVRHESLKQTGEASAALDARVARLEALASTASPAADPAPEEETRRADIRGGAIDDLRREMQDVRNALGRLQESASAARVAAILGQPPVAERPEPPTETGAFAGAESPASTKSAPEIRPEPAAADVRDEPPVVPAAEEIPPARADDGGLPAAAAEFVPAPADPESARDAGPGLPPLETDPPPSALKRFWRYLNAPAIDIKSSPRSK